MRKKTTEPELSILTSLLIQMKALLSIKKESIELLTNHINKLLGDSNAWLNTEITQEDGKTTWTLRELITTGNRYYFTGEGESKYEEFIQVIKDCIEFEKKIIADFTPSEMFNNNEILKNAPRKLADIKQAIEVIDTQSKNNTLQQKKNSSDFWAMAQQAYNQVVDQSSQNGISKGIESCTLKLQNLLGDNNKKKNILDNIAATVTDLNDRINDMKRLDGLIEKFKPMNLNDLEKIDLNNLRLQCQVVSKYMQQHQMVTQKIARGDDVTTTFMPVIGELNRLETKLEAALMVVSSNNYSWNNNGSKNNQDNSILVGVLGASVVVGLLTMGIGSALAGVAYLSFVALKFAAIGFFGAGLVCTVGCVAFPSSADAKIQKPL